MQFVCLIIFTNSHMISFENTCKFHQFHIAVDIKVVAIRNGNQSKFRKY